MYDLPAAEALRKAAAAARRLAQRCAREPRALDVLTALACLALMALDVPGLAAGDNSLNGVMAALVLTAGASSLLVRRVAPWVPFVVALVLLGWLHELTLAQFALYSLGRYRGRLAGAVGVAGYVSFAYVMFTLPGWPVHRGETLSEFLSLVVPIGVLAAGVGVAANRQDLVRELQAQRAATQALEAVQQERLRIARDVHDFVGRELTLLSVRSQVLARRAGSTPYATGFDELSQTARSAHRMLNEIIVQRGVDGTPTPGLEALPELAAASGRAGSPVELLVDGAAYRLSPLRQAAVHRVVQECLTNAAKHAPGEVVEVRVRVAGGRLRVTVRNALPVGAVGAVGAAGSAPGPAGAGFAGAGRSGVGLSGAGAARVAPVSAGIGTAGMAERVHAVGGTFTAGPHAGAYVVEADLPTGDLT
ncbi:sensor histidine kinase [Streptomyces flavofungini]|uniref:sensor histidine kinase n=1 Tax=Streptomyces flavofungini TaxID=68200 RepID=UPI0025B0D661|nr:histidine kinase [Streptomyces flavofungini]WJV48715.1 histidine kinase [Streptomyces flavofungini]